MTKLIDRTEEKMELAKELGLYSYHKEKLAQKETKITINDLTSMNFKPISQKEIQKKLRGLYFHGFDTSEEWAQVLIFSGIAVAVLIGGTMWATGQHNVAKILWMVCLFGVLVPISISMFRMSTIKDMLLISWSDEIPYGALLAVKEAKEKGIKDFRIYYPTRSEYLPIRIIADPIITGKKNSIEVEIFAWDDSKIYE